MRRAIYKTNSTLMPELVLAPDAPLATTPAPPVELALALDQSPAAVYLAQLSKAARRVQRSGLDAIAALVGPYDALNCPWHRLRYAHTAAIRTMLAERYAPATANRMLAALRRVLEEAWRLELMRAEEYQRAADLAPISAERLPAGRALPLEELQALLEACAADATPAGLRDGALISVLWSSGARRSEVAALQLGDYDRTEHGLTIRSGKGNKDRITYVVGGAITALADWLLVRGDWAGPLFVAISRGGHITRRQMTDQAVLVILRKRAAAAGVADVSPHDMRRTMITQVLEAGADLATAQKLAGHAKPETTARYDRRGERAKQAAAARLEIPHVPNVARRTLPLEEGD